MPVKIAAILGVALVAAALAFLVVQQRTGWTPLSQGPSKTRDGRPVASTGFKVFTNTADSCRTCHAAEFEDWSRSHHAHANRLVDLDLDRPAFDPARIVEIGSYSSEMKLDGGKPVILTMGPDGTRGRFLPEMVLAYLPLRQYLIPFPGGRWQSTELAYDPAADEWFNVYGEQDRRPDEWGFWTNRGMNWNSNCAACHMTGYEKNYHVATDTYDSKWDAQGISCAQCHPGLDGHAEAFASPPYPEMRTLDSEQVMDNCASCHSRRSELFGGFGPGDEYDDFYRLSLPSQPGLYYPDGQIRDEVFVYGSFIMSKMGGRAGVTCLDCHNPHSGELILPAENNALCMSCHSATPRMDAPVIEPVAHSFHPAESTGNSCVECHMTHTVYMERDPRRDHGFTIPDPQLTKELGIPNACNKCHDDQTVDWAIEWVEKWYGDKMDRPERDRARLIARAHAGEPGLGAELATAANAQDLPAWRATFIDLAANYAGDPAVIDLARDGLTHESALVRTASVRLLSQFPEAASLIAPLRDDPARVVRVEANWAARADLAAGSEAYDELVAFLEHNADQPGGAARFGQFDFARGRFDQAEDWLRTAISWDQFSVPLYQDLAMMQNARGNTEAATGTLEEGLSVNPDSPQMLFMLALIEAEQGELSEAKRHLEAATRADPTYFRAWYNLALLHAQEENLTEAMKAIRMAEEVDPTTPDAPYVRATLHLRLDEPDAAREAAATALRINPNHSPSRQILQRLGPPQPRPAP